MNFNKDSALALIADSNVSRETFEKLWLFSELVIEWNKAFNLISRQVTIDELWHDHILDCLQLGLCISTDVIGTKNSELPKKIPTEGDDLKPSAKSMVIYDIGSGAGFPGIILAILGLNCVLVERIFKKTVFLKEAMRKLMLKNDVINDDIKNIAPPQGECIIVSRAVSSISKLIKMSTHFINGATSFYFLKSNKQLIEIEEIKNNWSFVLKEFPNHYRNEGVILKLDRLERVDNGNKSKNNVNC